MVVPSGVSNSRTCLLLDRTQRLSNLASAPSSASVTLLLLYPYLEQFTC